MGQLQNPGSQERICFPSKEGIPKPILSFQNHGPSSPVAGGLCDRQRSWRAESQSLSYGWREAGAPQLGGMSDAAVDLSIAQHIPEEEKEEEEEAEAAAMFCLARAPNESCCPAEGDLDADSGMSHSQEWTLALPAHFEQGEGSVPWEVSGSPCDPAQHSSSSSMMTSARGHHPAPSHLLCQTCCLPLPLPLPSSSPGPASSTVWVAPTHLRGGKDESSLAEGQEEAGGGLEVGHHHHPHPNRWPSGLILLFCSVREPVLNMHSGMAF